MSLTIKKSIRTYPHHAYEDIKNAILGKRYELSLVFIGVKRARSLNKKYRNASYIPNVLSFPLEKTTGEIYITPHTAHTESKKFNMTPCGYVGYLFIHGLLHLKGCPHGATMDTLEKKYCTYFKLR